MIVKDELNLWGDAAFSQARFILAAPAMRVCKEVKIHNLGGELRRADNCPSRI
jgi:hypothetical protein